jgi:hypothetical protein
MNADLIPILVAIIGAAVAILLGLGGLTLALWRDVRSDIRALSVRIDTISERLARVEVRVGRLEDRVGGLEERVAMIDGRVAGIEGQLGARNTASG